MITRALKILIGVPVVLLSLILFGAAAYVGITDQSNRGIGLAIGFAVLAIIVLLLGRRILRSKGDEASEACQEGSVDSPIANSKFVTINESGQIAVHIKNVTEARTALTEMKLHIKDCSLKKKMIVKQQEAIRAGYTDHVRTRGPKFIGGGGVGRLIRGLQTLSRSDTRSKLASLLKPLETSKQKLDAKICTAEKVILQLEAYLVRNV